MQKLKVGQDTWMRARDDQDGSHGDEFLKEGVGEGRGEA